MNTACLAYRLAARSFNLVRMVRRTQVLGRVTQSSRNSIKPGVGYNTIARLAIIAVWRFLPCISEGSIEISWKQQQLLSICRTVRYSRVRSVWMSYRRYRSVRYRYLYRTELTEVSGTGIDAILVHVPVQTWVCIPAVYVQSILYPAFHGGTCFAR